jgi:asparagine synthase (glutamine-hydrolysing)
MCGIAGYTVSDGHSIDRATLINVRDTLYHRGPDDAGLYVSGDERVGLAHRRLAIIDLSARGHQPMPNEDETVWIVFNGEIYNFQELKNDLERRGHVFRGNSDTEVIIHAYEEYGPSCVNYLCGMFAFAIYDEGKKQLFLSRDRFGIKPLYYTFLKDGTFAFASELKSFFKLPEFVRVIHHGALGDYFKYRYIPAPKTIWKNVFKLRHGYCAIYDIEEKSFTDWQYYCLSEKISKRRNSHLDEVKQMLFKSVERHLISDVEVGTLLSGGIDSSAVTAIACSFHPMIRSFSIGFEPEQFSELPYAKSVAEHLNIGHIFEVIGDLDEDLMDKLSISYDEPLADSSCLPTYVLCRMVSDHVKVVLSGDGGDELFGGYDWYNTFLSDLKSPARPLFSLGRFFFRKSVHPFAEFEENDESLFGRYSDNPFNSVRFLQYVDMNTFMVDDILTKVDRASMAHSLEVRVPLLDHELVETVCSLDGKSFPVDSTDKVVLKRLVQNLLPGEILSRSKKGFSAPISSWGNFKEMGQTLLRGKSIAGGMFRRDFIKELMEDKYKNSPGMLWMIYVFEKWYSKWF